MARILVTDGEQRAALAVVRSLGRAGHYCVVCSGRGRSLAGASRASRAEVVVPDALGLPNDFSESVASLVRARQIDLVIPIAEPAMLALLGARQHLAPAVLPFPELDTFRRVADKSTVLAHAAQLGIRVPIAELLSSAGDHRRLNRATLRYPLVLKPSRSVGEANGQRAKLTVSYAGSWQDLETRLEAYPAAAYPILLQQRIVGPGVGIFLLLWDGEIVAQFAHRRLREKPPSGGVSVYRESIAPPPTLIELSRQLLDRLGWYGVAMVEYKLDAASGKPYLMEINGRFWGSLQLAVDAGVDFPALLVTLALGGRPVPTLSYQTGVRSRWWWGDVDHLLARLRRSPSELALPRTAPGRWRATMDFLRLWRRGDRNEVLRWADPLPFIRETIDWLHGR
jgi:predicted ATP-grasp superfamily ATP-dependent carboligase